MHLTVPTTPHIPHTKHMWETFILPSQTTLESTNPTCLTHIVGVGISDTLHTSDHIHIVNFGTHQPCPSHCLQIHITQPWETLVPHARHTLPGTNHTANQYIKLIHSSSNVATGKYNNRITDPPSQPATLSPNRDQKILTVDWIFKNYFKNSFALEICVAIWKSFPDRFVCLW